ncbi:uncharacterized protein ARMOST_22053 [Armillaria ostoyae]|uniref:Uncharacterized protein n=1 Tax=Armillaria ostoyae TaxID=47428 RepID=A0A284SBU6_ARMOS|nr:uncharacterized protein ARMOST_22053 [Armillaria ostoyae]
MHRYMPCPSSLQRHRPYSQPRDPPYLLICRRRPVPGLAPLLAKSLPMPSERAAQANLVHLSHYPPVLDDLCPNATSLAFPIAPLSNSSLALKAFEARQHCSEFRGVNLHGGGNTILHDIAPYTVSQIIDHHDLILGAISRGTTATQNVNKPWYHVVVHRVPVTVEVRGSGGPCFLEQ